jgi:all-trans-retinol 13,14-reductase
MEVSTPLTWRDYIGIPEGSLYGLARDFSNPQQTAVPARTKVPNLYFTGQNSNLHGAVGVTISAVLTSGEILGLEYLLAKITHA